MKQAVLLILLAVVMGCNERTNEQITHIKPQFINASDFEFIEMMRQSPINIDAESAQSVHHSNITFNYPHDLELKVINTGSPGEFAAIKAKVEHGAAYIHYEGERYDLLQFHWHTMSEHELNGEEFPMEVHFVHQKDGAKDLEDLLVIGVWFEVGESDSELSQILSDMPATEKDYRKIKHVDINHMIPASLESYRYAGSLTTPPFTESVQWIVMKRPMEVSEADLSAYKTMFPEGNTREVQPLNDRVVTVSAPVVATQ